MAQPISNSASEPRPCTRFALWAPASFRREEEVDQPVDGTGFVQNISRSGLLLDECSQNATPGSMVWLRASYFPGSTEVPIKSEVVRVTDSGFAVKFVHLSPAAEHLIERILPS